MLRIGVLGTENSHVAELTRWLTTQPDMQIAACLPGAGEPVPGAALVPSVDKMLVHADVFAIFLRDGRLHRELAIPLLDAGRRVFVDKPFAADPADAAAIIKAAKRSGGAVTSFSALRFAPARLSWEERVRSAHTAGDLTALGGSGKAQPQSRYAGAWFYGPHTLEMLAGWWPRDPQAVSSVPAPSQETLTTRWARDGVHVTMQWTSHDDEPFVLWWDDKGGNRHETTVPVESGYYDPAAKQIVRFLAGGSAPVETSELLQGVTVLANSVRAW